MNLTSFFLIVIDLQYKGNTQTNICMDLSTTKLPWTKSPVVPDDHFKVCDSKAMPTLLPSLPPLTTEENSTSLRNDLYNGISFFFFEMAPKPEARCHVWLGRGVGPQCGSKTCGSRDPEKWQTLSEGVWILGTLLSPHHVKTPPLKIPLNPPASLTVQRRGSFLSAGGASPITFWSLSMRNQKQTKKIGSGWKARGG